MSSCHTEFIPCSHCGRKGDYIVWDSVNTERNRELADKVKDESLFEWTCPHCGHREAVWYPCLYHDMNRRFMVFYCNDRKIDVPRDLKGQSYLLRLTRTPEEFIEKILILEQGLDDRAIAMMKPFVVGDLVLKGAPEDTALYFRCIDQGHFLFESFHEGESGGYVAYDLGRFYNWCVTQKLGSPLRDVFQVVDDAWAEKQRNKVPYHHLV